MPSDYTSCRMELRHLRYFVGVAENGNLSRAAARLHVSQPALTRQIRDLENELDRPLFVRRRHGVELTDAGRALLPQARKVLAAAAALVRPSHAAPDAPAIVRIAHSCSFDTEWIAPLLASGPRHRVQLHEVPPVEALQSLRAGRVDAIIAVKPRLGWPRNTVSTELWRIQPLVALSRTHRLARRRQIHLRELANEPWGLWDKRIFPGYTDNFVAACRAAGFRPRAVRAVSSLGDIFAHVMAGDFISFTASVVRQLPHPGVSLTPLVWPAEQRPVVTLVWKRHSAFADLLSGLAAQVAERCRGRAG